MFVRDCLLKFNHLVIDELELWATSESLVLSFCLSWKYNLFPSLCLQELLKTLGTLRNFFISNSLLAPIPKSWTCRVSSRLPKIFKVSGTCRVPSCQWTLVSSLKKKGFRFFWNLTLNLSITGLLFQQKDYLNWHFLQFGACQIVKHVSFRTKISWAKMWGFFLFLFQRDPENSGSWKQVPRLSSWAGWRIFLSRYKHLSQPNIPSNLDKFLRLWVGVPIF